MSIQFKWFLTQSAIDSQNEINRVRLLAFYFLRRDGISEFTIDHVMTWCSLADLPSPNPSRLRKNMRSSNFFIKGDGPNSFRLHRTTLDSLDSQFPELAEGSEDIVSTEGILPNGLLEGSRGYLVRLGEQINACYSSNIFDGCAVLMRRLLEVLLILTYRHLGIEGTIMRPDTRHKDLSQIVADAISNPVLKLSKAARDELDVFRDLGNLSAHRIEYNCRRGDLKPRILSYRASVEELLYRSGVKV
jgi:hypothetical protein